MVRRNERATLGEKETFIMNHDSPQIWLLSLKHPEQTIERRDINLDNRTRTVAQGGELDPTLAYEGGFNKGEDKASLNPSDTSTALIIIARTSGGNMIFHEERVGNVDAANLAASTSGAFTSIQIRQGR